MSIQPKAKYRFSVIPISIPVVFFIEMEQTFLKYAWNHKTLNRQSNLEKKNKAGGTTRPDFILYYKNIFIKTAWCCHKNRHKNQWNRNIESRNKLKHTQSTNFDEGAKNISVGKGHSLQ